MEEAAVMQSLREEGLISKPEVQAAGGMSFEIIGVAGDGVPRPPPRLEKLAMERKRKKKRVVTEEEIREKLERAERRRKVRVVIGWFFCFFVCLFVCFFLVRLFRLFACSFALER